MGALDRAVSAALVSAGLDLGLAEAAEIERLSMDEGAARATASRLRASLEGGQQEEAAVLNEIDERVRNLEGGGSQR